MGEVEDYRSFLRKYASYGYGLLYLKSGDFFAAQESLEKVLISGMETWSTSHLVGREVRDIMGQLVRRSPNGASEPRASEPRSTILSGSRKLQVIENANALLRSFPEDERLALFLTHVEEVPRQDVLAWTGRDGPSLDDLNRRLEEKLDGWSPELASGESGRDFFYRALRQHRLSAHFIPGIVNRLRAATLPASFPMTLFISILGALLLLFLFVPLVVRGTESWVERMDALHAHGWPLYATGSMAFDVGMLLGAFLLNSFLSTHAPPPLLAGKLRIAVPLLRVSVLFGMILLSIRFLHLGGVLFVMEGNTLPGTFLAFWVFRELWLVATVVSCMLTTYILAVRAAKQPDPEGGVS